MKLNKARLIKMMRRHMHFHEVTRTLPPKQHEALMAGMDEMIEFVREYGIKRRKFKQ